MRKLSWPLWCAHSAAEKPAAQITQNESLLLLPEWPCAAPGSASARTTTSWPWPRWCAPQQWLQKAAAQGTQKRSSLQPAEKSSARSRLIHPPLACARA